MISRDNIHPRRVATLLGLVVLAALVLRLAVLVYVGIDTPAKFYTYDSDGYVTRATNLVQYGIFANEDAPPLTPDVKRTPAYPLFLAGVFALVGRQLLVVVLLQIALGGLSVVLTYLLARELRCSPRAALVAASFVALDPVLTLLSNRLLTETLFTTLLVAGLWLLARFWRTDRLRLVIVSAVVIAVAALTRPIAQFLPLALIPAFVPAVQKRRRLIVAVGVFCLVSLPIMYGWAYRNYRAAGSFTLSTITDTNLIYYRARAVLADAQDVSQGAAWEQLEAEIEATRVAEQLSPADVRELQRRRALEIFRRYPGLTLKMLAEGAARLLFDPGYTIICTHLDRTSVEYECFPGQSTMNEPNVVGKALAGFRDMTIVQQGTLLGSMALLGMLYLGAAIGAWHFVRERAWTPLLATGIVVLYFVALSAGGEANYRFRAPIVPFVAVMAGAGYEQLLAAIRRWQASTPDGIPALISRRTASVAYRKDNTS